MSEPLSPRSCVVGAWLLVACSWSAVAHGEPAAEERAAAEALFLEGRELVDHGDLPAACERFAQSQKLDPQVGTLLYLATCHEQTGKTATAWIEFKDALAIAQAANKEDRVQQAKEGVERVAGLLSRMSITVASPAPGEVVRVNGKAVQVFDASLPFDPGTLTVSAEAPGREPVSMTVELAKGPVSQVVEVPALAMLAAPKPLSKPAVDHTLAFVVGGAGLGLGALGFAFGGAAWATRDAADSDCDGKLCSQAGLDGHDRANAFAWVSNVSLAVGGAALATGVVLFFAYDPAQADAPRAALVPLVDPVGGSAGFGLIGLY